MFTDWRCDILNQRNVARRRSRLMVGPIKLMTLTLEKMGFVSQCPRYGSGCVIRER